MKRFLAQLLFVALIVGFGAFFGLDQYAKSRDLNPADVHRSFFGSIMGRNADPGGANGECPPGEPAGRQSGQRETNASRTGVRAAEPSRGTQTVQPADREVRPAAAGVHPPEEAGDSFMNRLGNKLGEAVRILAGVLLGWIVSLLSGFLS